MVRAAGIGWQLARMWPGGRARERQLKRQGGHARKCPLCGVTPRCLPRNANGSLSRSRTTDAQKDAAGVMTAAQLAEHTALRRGAVTGKPGRPAERGPLADDPWAVYPAPAAPHLSPDREGRERVMTRTYTHPDVLTIGVAQGWAEPETDPTQIDWAARQAAAAIPFTVVNGHPVNPCQVTGIRHGRNEMGYWGETLMADALVTATWGGARWLLMVERGDGYGWAVPGGHVEPGETGTAAALRELAEETGLAVPSAAARPMPPRYVPDPRASDEAWAVTVPVHVNLGQACTCEAMPAVTGGDDASRARWVPADTYGQLTAALASQLGGQLFAAHRAMLSEFLSAGWRDAPVR